MKSSIIIGLLLFCASQLPAQSLSLQQDSLKLTSPNGGEIFFIGSDTIITWTGISLTDTVKLEYSIDAGSTWNFITDTANGGSYRWHVPKPVSSSCLVRVGHPLFNKTGGWLRGVNTSNSNFAVGHGITVDAFGNVYVTGWFGGTVNFGGTILTSSGGEDIFVAKYFPSGNIDWIKSCGSNLDDEGYRIALDISGNIYVSGSYDSSAKFGGISVPGNGNFLAKFLQDGSVDWVKGGVNGLDLALDSAENIYISGNGVTKYLPDGSQVWSRTGMIGSNISIDKLGNVYLSNTGVNAGIWKYRPDGSLEWKTNITGASLLEIDDMSVNSIGEVYFCGGFDGAVNFGGFTLTGSGVFAAKYRLDGSGEWVNNPCDGYGYGISIDNFGDCFITGEFLRVAGFGQDTITSFGVQSIFLAEYTKDGIGIWGKKAGGQLSAWGYGLIVDRFGVVYTTGFYSDTAIFPKDTLINSTSGWPDPFIWKLGNYSLESDTSDAVFSIVRPKALVSIPNDSGCAGDHKYIPMILEKVPVTSIQSVATNFSARIAYDHEVLDPIGGAIQKGNRFDTISISGSLGTSDTLGILPFTALLGESTVSPLNIVDFNWLDGAGNPADYDADTKSGIFTVLYGCGDSLLRNFMITGVLTPSISINPNPSNGIIHIEIRTTETGRTRLELMNLLGEKVATISDGELKPGVHTFDFNPRDQSAGSYFMVMTTPSSQKMARVDLQK